MKKELCKLIKLLGSLMLILFTLTECNPVKKLKEGEFLLEKNIIVDNNKSLDKSELEAFLRQKPNRKIAKVIPFHLWLYSQIDQDKLKIKKEKRNKKFDKINAKRAKKHKLSNDSENTSPSDLKYKFKDKTKPLFLENILEIGEAPVIHDSFLTNVSKEQLNKYLKTKGYFNSTIKTEIKVAEYKKLGFFKLKRPHAKVTYEISKSLPYKINVVSYQIKDEVLEKFIIQDSVECLLKKGINYDAAALEKERERILKKQKNNGYYELSPEHIFFKVDSNLNTNQLNIAICLKQISYRPDNNHDTIVYRNHKRFKIGKIVLANDFNPDIKATNIFTDTIFLNGVSVVFNKKSKFRIKDLTNKVLIHEGDYYSASIAEDTYNKFTELKVFKTVNISFKNDLNNSELLNCFIYLSPVKKQSFTVETEGTNTSGNLGIAGSFVYQNRNIFKGAEILEIALSTGLTAQKNLATEKEFTADLGIPLLDAFNTFQFGPEINLFIPKQLFPFSLFKFSKNAAAKTVINSSFNYQKRPEFTRLLSNISYGLTFKSGEYLKQQIIPFEVSFIRANLEENFQNALEQTNDAFLKNSFIDHITPVSRYSINYNNQTNKTTKSKKVFVYFKADFESSGSALRGLFNLTNRAKDDSGRYRIFNVPFSQFLRAYSDFRLYKSIGKLGRIVFRTALGIGKPLNNLSVLPYEKSFFGGGPNSVRAWKARALGPGAYSQTNDNTFDKIGDSQIEFNLEYRFNIYKFLNGAFFVDAGNIWLLKPDALKPNGDLKIDKFYKELATGTGMGLRADFDFFILRLDAAFKIYSPKLPEGDRWMFNKKPLTTTVFNFGIGYPF